MDRYLKRFSGAVVFSLLYIVLIFIFSIIAYKMNFSDEVLSAVSFVIMNICMFLCSVSAAGKSETKGWLNGIVSGVIFTVIILIASIIIGGDGIDVHKLLVRLPLYALIAFTGGIVGINLK